MPHVALPQPHDRLGSYRLLFPLGQGGMASVFVAQAEAGACKGQRVACKILLPHLQSDPRWRTQLLAEAHTTAAIHDNNVIRVLDIPQDADAGFFVMEWREGLPLDRLLAQAGKLPLPLACAVLAQTARGLAAAHAAADEQGKPLHIVHRDVSPHNIHVGCDGVVKLLDFGISAAEGNARLTRTGEWKGKLAYVAPEQVTRSHDIDFRCDVWALGAVAYEALTGRCLFAADDEATTLWNVTAVQVPSLADAGCVVPAAVANVIEACLQRDPSLRPANAADVADTFEAFAATPSALGALVQQHETSAPTQAPRADSRRRLWWAGSAFAAAAALATIVAAARPPRVSTQPLQPVAAKQQAAQQASAKVMLPTSAATPAAPPRSSPAPAVRAKRRAALPLPAAPPARVAHPDLVSNPYKDLVENPY